MGIVWPSQIVFVTTRIQFNHLTSINHTTWRLDDDAFARQRDSTIRLSDNDVTMLLFGTLDVASTANMKCWDILDGMPYAKKRCII